jgi:hypothetical protein
MLLFTYPNNCIIKLSALNALKLLAFISIFMFPLVPPYEIEESPPNVVRVKEEGSGSGSGPYNPNPPPNYGNNNNFITKFRRA